MANSDLKNVIENARKAQGYSQRQLAKQIGLSQSTYNDTINGKIKKVRQVFVSIFAVLVHDFYINLVKKRNNYCCNRGSKDHTYYTD